MTTPAIVLFATLAGGPTPPPTPPAPAMPTPRVEARFDRGRSARKIPIEIAGDGIAFVRGKVRDADAWFLLDTASASVLSKRFADRLGLASTEGFFGTGMGEDPFPVRMLSEVIVRLPGVELTQAHVSSFDLDSLQIALGHRVDGILGVPVFQSLVVELDYSGAAVTLSDPKTYRLSGKAAALPVKLAAGLPYVEGNLALPRKPPLAGSFLIDTGVDNAVILYSPLVDSRGLLGKVAKAPPEIGPGAGGGTLEAVLRAERLELGPFAFRQPIVRLSRSTKGLLADGNHAGLIGGAVLSRFRVTLDLPHLRLGLEKNARYEEPFLDDASGLSLVAQGADLSTFLIRRVSPGSPGSEAGFTAGDVLLAVDGKLAKDIGLREIRRLLQQDGRRYVLTVFRNGAVKKLTVECRRQL